MPTDSLSFDTLAEAVKDVLASVSGIGYIENRPGGVAEWAKTAHPRQPYWEIEVRAAEEELASIGTQAFEHLTVRLEGWMQHSYQNPNSSSDSWRPLLKRVRDRLRKYPTLALVGEGMTGHGFMPQVRVNDLVSFSDTERHVVAHHCIIEMRYTRYFSFTTSVTL